jgi:hypothetical protein
MSSIVYRVMPHVCGGWQVRRDGANRASARTTTLNRAVHFGERLCKKRGAALFIHKRGIFILEPDALGYSPQFEIA